MTTASSLRYKINVACNLDVSIFKGLTIPLGWCKLCTKWRGLCY